MSRLVVELLEYPYLDMESCEVKRDQIRRAGSLFAVDDFGTGIADIDLVRALKPDFVKLDRSYIEKSREVYGDRSGWLNSFLSDLYGIGRGSRRRTTLTPLPAPSRTSDRGIITPALSPEGRMMTRYARLSRQRQPQFL